MQLNLWSAADPADDEFHARVAEAKAPDVAALYREEAPRLGRLFGRRTQQSDMVQDLVQSIFVRFLGRPAAPQRVLDEPRAYLMRIACNLLHDTARQWARRSEQFSVNIEEMPEPENPLVRLEARDLHPEFWTVLSWKIPVMFGGPGDGVSDEGTEVFGGADCLRAEAG